MLNHVFFPHALSAQRCQEILHRAFELPVQDGTVGVDRQFKVDHAMRYSQVRWFKPGHQHRDLFDDLWLLVRKANVLAWGMLSLDYMGEIQFTTYDGSGEVKGHYDWHADDHGDLATPYTRKLSVVCQLSDPADYEGGDFEIAGGGLPKPEELKARGSVLVFPSRTKHRVSPVVKGIRHSLVAWAQAPQLK
jgi:PKHD-type hydroxylase